METFFADFPKTECVERAVRKCQEDPNFTARKAGKVYHVSHSTITQRLNDITQSRKTTSEGQQSLTPARNRKVGGGHHLHFSFRIWAPQSAFKPLSAYY